MMKSNTRRIRQTVKWSELAETYSNIVVIPYLSIPAAMSQVEFTYYVASKDGYAASIYEYDYDTVLVYGPNPKGNIQVPADLLYYFVREDADNARLFTDNSISWSAFAARCENLIDSLVETVLKSEGGN